MECVKYLFVLCVGKVMNDLSAVPVLLWLGVSLKNKVMRLVIY